MVLKDDTYIIATKIAIDMDIKNSSVRNLQTISSMKTECYMNFLICTTGNLLKKYCMVLVFVTTMINDSY